MTMRMRSENGWRPRHWGFPLFVLWTCLLLSCSESRLSGTSSDVDNPELVLAIHAGEQSALPDITLSGFQADQNPLKDKNAWFSLRLRGDSKGVLPAVLLEQSSLAEIDSGAGAEANFNLVFLSETRGAIVNGLSFDPVKRIFRLDAKEEVPLDTLSVTLVPRVDVSGTVDSTGRGEQQISLFVPGTPFHASVAGDSFTFEGLPQGVHPLLWQGDSGQVREVVDSLDTQATLQVLRLDNDGPGDEFLEGK